LTEYLVYKIIFKFGKKKEFEKFKTIVFISLFAFFDLIYKLDFLKYFKKIFFFKTDIMLEDASIRCILGIDPKMQRKILFFSKKNRNIKFDTFKPKIRYFYMLCLKFYSIFMFCIFKYTTRFKI
jgi:hypothetical protein